MRKLFFILCAACLLTSACSSWHIGPKGEGEYVVAESLVPYDENNVRQMKKDGILAAQKAAVEKVAGVFISSTASVEQAQLVEDKITSKTAGFVRKTHVQKAYRKGDDFYTKIKAMVLVKDIGEIIKQSEAEAFAKKTTIIVASHETINEDPSLTQTCKQAIYRVLKSQPYSLVNGDNLSQHNLENPNPTIDKARTDGARFLIIADVAAAPISTLATGITSPFKSYRARANLHTYATNNYALVAEGAQQQSGLDPLEEIAAQKSISAACESAAKQLVQPIDDAINSAHVFSVTIKNVNTLERLRQLQDVLRTLREIEDFNLVRYANSAAKFDISANIATSEELAAKIIRKYYTYFTVLATTPSTVVLNFN